MIDGFLQKVAPHYCCGCQTIGSILCVNCKNNIIEAGQVLLSPTSWCVGWRNDTLEAAINQYKFGMARAAAKDFSELLDMVVPILPPKTIVVPIPTIARHIRQRSFDHALLLAKTFARARHLPCRQLLYRRTNTVQLGASAALRQQQAKQAFGVRQAVPALPVLLIDDIRTTGATLKQAAQLLNQAGATTVYSAVIAQQPLD